MRRIRKWPGGVFNTWPGRETSLMRRVVGMVGSIAGGATEPLTWDWTDESCGGDGGSRTHTGGYPTGF